MKSKHFCITAISAALLSACASGPTNYYIDSANGNDDASGKSPEKAWRTLERIGEAKLSPGDSILLRRGSVFNEYLQIEATGTADAPVVIAAYGEGNRPVISAPDSSVYALAVTNSSYLTVRDLEVINTGSSPMAGRTGVRVLCENHGISRGITLRSLYIHDVNGSLVKEEGGGSGILIENRYDRDSIVSRFDSLTIENCVIRRCGRNGMIWGAPWSRAGEWHPNTNVVVRGNLIEQVPGDGIVPIGCDGAIIEYNLMRDCPMTLPDSEAAAGFWPWSCDNTIIRFNEVSDHKAPWDAQGFDSDYNCTGTVIEYNYSHDNDGGFLLVCNSGDSKAPHNIGNTGSIVRYNISVGDAVRQRPTRSGIFSPTIHFAGPTDNTLIEYNILYATAKPSDKVDRHMLISDTWGGYASNATFKDNIFFSADPSAFKLTESTGFVFDGNSYLGRFAGRPSDSSAKTGTEISPEIIEGLLRKVPVADGEATLTTVDKEKIERFFENMK